MPPKSAGTPSAEFEIEASLVSALLGDQHPDLAHLPVRVAEGGWDNANFRLGGNLAVRLPRRAPAAELIVNEQTWLPRLGEMALPIPIPVPVRIGLPARGYPWRWSILTWLRGDTADRCLPDASESARLGAFLRTLHRPAPPDAPTNPFRGVSLRQRAATVAARMQRLAAVTDLITPDLVRIWRLALEAPIDLRPTWLHGDLHSRNVLVHAGTISGIIDWGDLTAGDPATDLASIWMLFGDPSARRAALAAYGLPSEATVSRARGWAVLFGVMLLDSGLIDDARNAAIGEAILRRIAEQTPRDKGDAP